jgi:purine nucleosidase
MKIIIDCDVGVDDAFAIMLASLLDDIEILAITVVHGNSNAENCYANTKLLLDKLYKDLPQPPIYVGASRPIIGEYENKSPYFGTDGLCGKTETLYYNEITEIKSKYIENVEQHAAVKIVELINNNPDEITVICLGPLTNLALALRLSQDQEKFCSKIKKLIIMGGDEPSDTVYKSVEMNFAIDPMSAKIVIDEYKCQITICTFQMAVRNYHKSVDISLVNDLFEKYIETSPRCRFMQSIGIIFNNDNKIKDNISCDYVTMLLALREKECRPIYKKYNSCSVDVIIEKGLIKVSEEDQNDGNIQFAFDIEQVTPYNYLEYCIKKMAQMDETGA